MELRVLRYFLTVAQTENISVAAKILHITQPTLSRQLRELEKEIQATLFVRNRHSHRIELTEQGFLLRQRAAEMVALADKTLNELQNVEEDINGDLYIGGGESHAMLRVAEALLQLQKRYPHVKPHFFSGNGALIEERLEQGLLDVGVMMEPVSVKKYHCLQLPEVDRHGLLMRRDHPLAKNAVIEPKDLQGIPLLAARPDQVGAFLQAWEPSLIEQLNIVGTYTLIYNATLMVEAGLGCAVCLENLVDTNGSLQLCFRPFSPPLEVRWYVVWKKNAILSRATEKLLEELRLVCAEKSV